jgi:hypothetical protein
MGLLFRCPHIVKQLRAVFETEMDPEASYQVMQQGGRLVWRETVDGKVLEHDGEPLAPWRRRIPAKIIAWLPIESQL